MLSLLRDLPVHGIVHITGGGIDENIIRVIPSVCKAIIHKDAWEVPPVFKMLQKEGNVPDSEMQRTFNNGIGMVIVVPEASAEEVMDRLASMNQEAFFIGEIKSRDNNEGKTDRKSVV